MIPRRRAVRSFDDALAVVSPLAFADSVEAYLTGLPPEELRPLVLRSIKRMDPSERAQFALFLGHDMTHAPIDEVGGPTLPSRELQTLVESCDDLLPNRFAAFLRENPRAVASMGSDARQAIFDALEARGDLSLAALEDSERRRRIPAGIAALAGLTVIVAIVPLAAQYAHQRGMISGLSDVAVMPGTPASAGSRDLHRAMPRHRIARRPVMNPRVRHIAKAPERPVLPAGRNAGRGSVRRVHVYNAPTRHVAVWKFDPSQNPYVSGHWNRTRVAPHRQVAYAPPVSHRQSGPPSFEERARLAVGSYLHAVIAGNTPSALHHLGLPSDASSANISEAPIVTRDARAQIVGTKTMPDGKTRVQVDIAGRRGEYFEVFEVMHDGQAVRIADRYYIPVNRTAEELSARLLAKNTH